MGEAVGTEPKRHRNGTERNRQSTGTNADAPAISGPHAGYDRDGRPDHRYYRCECCGLESTDPRLLEGCFRCGAGAEEGRDGDPAGTDREEVGDGRG